MTIYGDEQDDWIAYWATKNRKFWFLGPIDWIRFECKLGTLRGILFIGKNAIVFKTLEKMSGAEKLLPQLKQQGLKVDFQEVKTFTVEISVWDNKPFSPRNAQLFLEKLERQMKKRKLRPPRDTVNLFVMTYEL